MPLFGRHADRRHPQSQPSTSATWNPFHCFVTGTYPHDGQTTAKYDIIIDIPAKQFRYPSIANAFHDIQYELARHCHSETEASELCADLEETLKTSENPVEALLAHMNLAHVRACRLDPSLKRFTLKKRHLVANFDITKVKVYYSESGTFLLNKPVAKPTTIDMKEEAEKEESVPKGEEEGTFTPPITNDIVE